MKSHTVGFSEILSVLGSVSSQRTKECNVSTKHVKPRKQGEQGSIAKVESPLYSSLK